MKSEIKVVIYGRDYDTKAINFPSGEIHASLSADACVRVRGGYRDTIYVVAKIRDSDGVLATAQIVDAIEEINETAEVVVVLPYFPSSRQDKVYNPGEAIDRDIITRLFVNNEIITLDMHSDYREDDVTNLPQYFILETILDDYDAWVYDTSPGVDDSLVILGPDKGSHRKLIEWRLGTKHKQHTVDFCDKVRDPATGKLSGFKVPGGLEGKEVLLVDDICDSGGTAIGLGREILKQNPKSLILMVTHGVFSKGISPLMEVFNQVVCTDSIVDQREIRHENLFIIPAMKFLYELGN